MHHSQLVLYTTLPWPIRYSTTLDKWELISEMHYERSRGLGCARFGGYVWTMGGMDKNGRALNTVERPGNLWHPDAVHTVSHGASPRASLPTPVAPPSPLRHVRSNTLNAPQGGAPLNTSQLTLNDMTCYGNVIGICGCGLWAHFCFSCDLYTVLLRLVPHRGLWYIHGGSSCMRCMPPLTPCILYAHPACTCAV